MSFYAIVPLLSSHSLESRSSAGKENGPFRRTSVSSLLVKEEMGVDVTVKRERGSSMALYIQSVKIKNQFIDKNI